MMERIILRKGGRITLPAGIRERLGLSEGSVLQVDVRDDEIVLRIVKK